MIPIPIVTQEEVDIARRIEAKLLVLSPESGILFVGISVKRETADGRPVYHVWLGCSREREESLYDPLVRVTLREEILLHDLNLHIEAHRGIGRK